MCFSFDFFFFFFTFNLLGELGSLEISREGILPNRNLLKFPFQTYWNYCGNTFGKIIDEYEKEMGGKNEQNTDAVGKTNALLYLRHH